VSTDEPETARCFVDVVAGCGTNADRIRGGQWNAKFGIIRALNHHDEIRSVADAAAAVNPTVVTLSSSLASEIQQNSDGTK